MQTSPVVIVNSNTRPFYYNGLAVKANHCSTHLCHDVEKIQNQESNMMMAGFDNEMKFPDYSEISS